MKNCDKSLDPKWSISRTLLPYCLCRVHFKGPWQMTTFSWSIRHFWNKIFCRLTWWWATSAAMVTVCRWRRSWFRVRQALGATGRPAAVSRAWGPWSTARAGPRWDGGRRGEVPSSGAAPVRSPSRAGSITGRGGLGRRSPWRWREQPWFRPWSRRSFWQIIRQFQRLVDPLEGGRVISIQFSLVRLCGWWRCTRRMFKLLLFSL